MEGDAKAKEQSSEVSLDTLAGLGLGPDAPLLNDPKLFVDARFLGSLIAELDVELGRQGASSAMFQIGAAHGVREARRLLAGAAISGEDDARALGATSTSLPMQLSPVLRAGAGIGFEGEWPEAHEAEARLGRTGRASHPACWLSAGYTSGWLSETHDLDIVAVEVCCAAAGSSACRFEAAERSTWLLESSCPVDRLPTLERPSLGQSAPEPFRAANPATDVSATLDPSDEAVHVWGPVMVLPFTRPEDALATVHLLGRDRTTASVRAVVIDLRQHPLDPGYGAEILGQTLEAIETWGAEAILTGICDLSAPLVAEITTHPMLTRKDLPEAVASAFQIAEAQRHPL